MAGEGADNSAEVAATQTGGHARIGEMACPGWYGIGLLVLVIVAGLSRNAAEAEDPNRQQFPLFNYLTGTPTPTIVAYSPSELDPRFDGNHAGLATSSIRDDLIVLRHLFDGLVLYGYHEASTPRILAEAKALKFRAVLLGVWDPKSAAEVDGVAAVVKQHHKDLALGVVVGNEGLAFDRYQPRDLNTAADRLLSKIPSTIPVTTSEPLRVCLESGFVRYFGDFMAPSIHPVWDRPELAADAAARWTREQALKLALKAGKPVLVRETGFPHAGKGRYTPETQRAFWASYLQAGILAHPPERTDIWIFHGVAFEAFDLPWKAKDSGIPLEKSWGLFSANRQGYPGLVPWQRGPR